MGFSMLNTWSYRLAKPCQRTCSDFDFVIDGYDLITNWSVKKMKGSQNKVPQKAKYKATKDTTTLH